MEQNGFNFNFSGKVAIITGSSSGIGAATAKLFAAHGALITIVGRNESRLNAVSTHCQTASGHKPLSLVLDLTVEGSCETLVNKTIETFKRIDILVNCAGKAILTSLFDSTMEIFDDIVALNLRVPYKLTKLCVPHLKITHGNIVNVCGAKMRPRPGFLPFGMCRDAMERFTESGALELADEGIRMNAVRPGITRTNFLANLNIQGESMDIAYENLAQLVPGRTIIEPEEIARMILFVASDCCPNLNACVVVVDSAAQHY